MSLWTIHRRTARRLWPAYQRFVVAVLIALVFHGLYAGWHWHTELRTGRGLRFISPTGSIWRNESARIIVANWAQESLRMWSSSVPALSAAWQSNLIHTIPTVLPSSVVGIIAFAMLSRRIGRPDLRDPHSRCRRCRYIFIGLQSPRCPECGEMI
ncbi:MAG: hypothetical protein HS101_09680 [Planctomycetia bacterium]|nr:hypothetical protein [Planctomycetia bacterium]MCC7313739.1 hypothetical protein [Planctomycetota bacterium]